MSKMVLVARILLGLIFTVFGLNGFFNFIPVPENLPEAVTNFMGAMMATGYMLTLIKATETACGILLLVGRFVPLALTVLAPVVVNILLFHTFVAPGLQNMAVPLVILVLGIYLAYAYRSSFAGVLNPNAQPGSR